MKSRKGAWKEGQRQGPGTSGSRSRATEEVQAERPRVARMAGVER